MWGMTPITEAVIQGRGQGGLRQQRNDLILVSGNGRHAELPLDAGAVAARAVTGTVTFGELQMSDTNHWLPEPNDLNRPFFDGARAGELRLQACRDCGGWMYPVRRRCQHCGSTALEWRTASGRGTLYSHARLAREYHPRHAGRLPLVLAWVDTEEGVRLPTNLVDCDPAAAKCGMAVQVTFETFPDGGVIPVFRPAA
jgi:uncharacterized OB-fold protein